MRLNIFREGFVLPHHAIPCLCCALWEGYLRWTTQIILTVGKEFLSHIKISVHLNALRAYEDSARHQSFSMAAEEITCHACRAVGQLVRTLEDTVGYLLFQRHGNRRAGLVLTEPASRALPDIQAGFDRQSLGMTRLREGATGGTLNITLSPALAVNCCCRASRIFRVAGRILISGFRH